MKQTLIVLAGVALLAMPALAQTNDSDFRLFLDKYGEVGNDPLTQSPSMINPEVMEGVTTRLYVWAQVLGTEAPQKYVSVGYNVKGEGGATIVGADTWNYTNILPRWSVFNPGQLGGGELMNVRLACDPSGKFGVGDNNTQGFDLQHDVATTSTVLGWVDVTGPNLGEIYLEIGDITIIRTNTIGNPDATYDDVYLGFGDEGAGGMGNMVDWRSPRADATIIPEPASLLLLGLAGLAIRRR